MNSNKAGVTFVALLLLLVSISFAYVLTTPTGSGLTPQPGTTKYTATVNLGADAAGWELNYNASLRNPTLYFNTSTLVNFNLKELDGAPHNLIICYDGVYSSSLFSEINSTIATNPSKWENQGSNYQIASTSDITQVIGNTVTKSYPFQTAGIYTYWCSIHYLAMFGIIVIGSGSGSTSLTVHQPFSDISTPSLSIDHALVLPYYAATTSAQTYTDLVW